jgi:hypothetical protein
MIMLAATIGVAYGAGVHDGAASHSCIEPTSKPFGDGEMLTEFGPHVVSGEVSDFAGAGVVVRVSIWRRRQPG